MKPIRFSFSFFAVVSMLASVTMACGGGSGGGGNNTGACTNLCAQLESCATTLATDVGTLAGDDTMTASNCVSECTSLTCSNKAAFLSCTDGFTCSNIDAVKTALSTCGEAESCGGGGGGSGCTTMCADLVSCATTLDSTVATLSGDVAMTPANCVAECQNLTCTDKASFIDCTEGLTCSTVDSVVSQVHTCGTTAGCFN